ncbi:hypothetical protein YPPY34_1615, partial [Yersinia pestis PY-34]
MKKPPISNTAMAASHRR